jgi:hypothetical protein
MRERSGRSPAAATTFFRNRPTADTADRPRTLERLGGNAAISAVMTDFVDKQVVPDKRINADP